MKAFLFAAMAALAALGGKFGGLGFPPGGW
jgi:hypothetical protein